MKRYNHFWHSAVSAFTGAAVLVTAVASVLPAVSLETQAGNSVGASGAAAQTAPDTPASQTKQTGGAASDSAAVGAARVSKDTSAVGAAQDELAVKAPAPEEVGDDGATYLDRLTDRSNDIGVPSEGYTDSPYTVSRTIQAGTDFDTAVFGENDVGGTYFFEQGEKNTFNDQFWDGQMPFRLTAAPGAAGHSFQFSGFNDFSLENDINQMGAIKFDNLTLEYCRINLLSSLQNIYARGNKIVIGENVTTESGKTWKLYGGNEHDDLINTGQPRDITNVVVASGTWGWVFGGGEGATGKGTQVTVRGTANIDKLYGGGERRGSVGIDETGRGDGVNIYVEGGTVNTLFGGSAINDRILLAGGRPLTVNEDVNINVSGGTVGKIIGSSDTTDTGVMSASTLSNSPVNGDLTVNISAPNSVGSVAGDPNRNHSSAPRQIKGTTRLNVTASNAFTYFDDFDVVNIEGDGVVVSSASKPGVRFTDSDLTFWGNQNRDGYIGQIRVADGAKLVLDQGGVINRPYSGNTPEADTILQATQDHPAFHLSKSWVGESSADRRSLSTVAINGQGAGITAASGTAFNDASNVCGLRIYGNVQGAPGDATGYNEDAPGYSTLEVTGTPIYSTGSNYYYYIVADGSANGGKAFTEPEGADYVVCYHFLDNGKIGWYLRERPTVSLQNKLVRAGETADAAVVMHVDLNGFAYEWSNTTSNNNVDLQWTKTTGTDAAALTAVTEGISRSALAAIESDTSGRFQNVVFITQNGVRYLSSFDYVIDDSTPVDPVYYEAAVDYHVVGTYNSAAYEDDRQVNTADAARCVYDFAGNDALHANDGYDDSVMLTYPYSTTPAGADTALLRLYLPHGVTGALSVTENDGSFRFTTNTTVDAQLIDSATVISDYSSATEATANSRFAVTVGGGELSSGVSKTLSSAVSSYACTVYSHQAVTIEDISQNSANGLQLRLGLSGLNRNGAAVGGNDPAAVSNGELQIQTVPLNGTIPYQLIYHFRTRTQGEQDFVEKGELTFSELVAMDNQLSNAFVMSKAPYESNRGENLYWSDSSITRYTDNGVLTAYVTAVQNAKQVSVSFTTTPDGPFEMENTFMAGIGANRLNDENVARISVPQEANGLQFNYWAIRKSPDSSAPIIAKCYDADFTYCIMDNYWIRPVYSASAATPAQDGKLITLTHLEYTRNRWTDSEGVPAENGRSDYLYTDFEIAFTDSGNAIFESGTAYRTGVAFELCRQIDLDNNEQFVQGYDYGFVSNEANLKQAILNRSSTYNADGSARKIQYSDIPTANLTNKNRIEFAKSYYNAYKIEAGVKKYTNATYIMKATAYYVDSELHVTLSNPVYICLYDISQHNLALN